MLHKKRRRLFWAGGAAPANTITSVKGYQLRFIANSQQFFTLYDRLKPLFCVSYAAFNVCYLTGPRRDSANLERRGMTSAFLLSLAARLT